VMCIRANGIDGWAERICTVTSGSPVTTRNCPRMMLCGRSWSAWNQAVGL